MSTKKAVLGKGLSALLPSVSSDQEGGEGAGGTSAAGLYNFEERVRLLGRVAEVEVDNVRPNPYQPRQDFDEEALEELTASIREIGIVQPITVRALGDGRFELISGERRLRAARRAGLKRLPAYVREADTEALLEMAIVENIQREDLNPVEVALGYRRLVDECQLTQEEVAQKVGKSRSAVANALRLLKLPATVIASLRDGTLTGGHARMLVAVEDPEVQLQMHRRIVDRGLSVRQVEDLVRRYRRRLERGDGTRTTNGAEKTPPAPRSREALQIEAITGQLRDRLATQVSIRHRDNGGGRIEIDYYSAEDLERVLDLVLGR
jgi:ParB family transcriptional regulator, chromosome partitioning protein